MTRCIRYPKGSHLFGVREMFRTSKFSPVIYDDHPKTNESSNMGCWHSDVSGTEAVKSLQITYRVNKNTGIPYRDDSCN